MNIQIIKDIISNPMWSDEEKQNQILSELSKDEDILLHFLKVLSFERDRKKNCMADMQTILADIHISQVEKHKKWAGGIAEILGRIEPIFRKYKGLIWHHVRGNFEQ